MVAIVAWAPRALADEKVVVTDTQGAKTSGVLKQWSTDLLAVEAELLKEVPRRNLRSIIFENLAKSISGSIIQLSNGDRIAARAVRVAEDRLTINWPLAAMEKLNAIPLERVTAIIFDLSAAATDQQRMFADIATLPRGSDLVILSNGDHSTGEFQQLDSAFLEIKSAAGALKLDRGKVRAVRFNPELTTTSLPKGPRLLLSLTDGSRLTATVVEMVDNMLKVKSSTLGDFALPVQAVSRCDVFGDHIVPLSDREPAKVEFTPFLSTTWPLVRNANVLYGPLRLRGTEFACGLGMHSQMAATYELQGRESSFQSLVGIDDSADNAGSVVFAVEVDGRRVWNSDQITGRSKPIAVPGINLQGAKRLTLIVEFGEYADIRDYADWCDAVLLLESGP